MNYLTSFPSKLFITTQPENRHAKWLLIGIFALGFGLYGITAHASAFYDAGGSGQLSIISIVDSNGDDGSPNVDVSLDPSSGPFVSNDNASVFKNAIANNYGTAGSSLTSPPSSGFLLDQSSETHGLTTPVGNAFSAHETLGSLILRLADGITDTYTVNLELRYSAFANAGATDGLLEYAIARGYLSLIDSLAFVNFTQDLNADTLGISGNDNIAWSGSYLFSIILDGNNTVDQLTLSTLAFGEARSVPVPATLWIMGLGLPMLGLGGNRTKRLNC